MDRLSEAAELLYHYNDYSAFSKRRTQVQSFDCLILESNWSVEDKQILYTVKANRFRRGMVRGLVGTMLQIGRGKLNVQQLREIIESKDPSQVDFSVPAKGLFLNQVLFPAEYF